MWLELIFVTSAVLYFFYLSVVDLLPGQEMFILAHFPYVLREGYLSKCGVS